MDTLRTKLVIFFAICYGVGSCASTPTWISSASTRLTNGTVVSAQDYGANANGSASIAVGIDATNTTCPGVMISPNQFITNCVLSFIRVIVGSRHYLPESLSDGQILNVTGGPTDDSNPNVQYLTYPTTGIPPGSKAVPAQLYPAGSQPPGPGAECLAYGYSGPAAPYMLNTRPAIILTTADCKAFFPTLATDATQFCANVTDANGATAICTELDLHTGLMCKGTSRRELLPLGESAPRVPAAEGGHGGLARLCLFNSHLPICQLFCYLNPYCGTFEPLAEEQASSWYLAGIEINSPACGTKPNTPSLYNVVSPK